jgi:hypothetical protein
MLEACREGQAGVPEAHPQAPQEAMQGQEGGQEDHPSGQITAAGGGGEQTSLQGKQ